VHPKGGVYKKRKKKEKDRERKTPNRGEEKLKAKATGIERRRGKAAHSGKIRSKNGLSPKRKMAHLLRRSGPMPNSRRKQGRPTHEAAALKSYVRGDRKGDSS